MSVAEPLPVSEENVSRVLPPGRNGPWAGYLLHLMARMLELKREPEVVFARFGFLAFHFLNSCPDSKHVFDVRET